jgi:hypothetical protein
VPARTSSNLLDWIGLCLLLLLLLLLLSSLPMLIGKGVQLFDWSGQWKIERGRGEVRYFSDCIRLQVEVGMSCYFNGFHDHAGAIRPVFPNLWSADPRGSIMGARIA